MAKVVKKLGSEFINSPRHQLIYMVRTITLLAAIGSFSGCGQSGSGAGAPGNSNEPSASQNDIGTLWLGGTFISVNGKDCRNLAQIKSETVTCYPIEPLSSITNIRKILYKDAKIYVIGKFSHIAGVQTNGIGKFAGDSWSSVGSNIADLGGNVFDLLVKADNEVYASTYNNSQKIWKFNGSAWQDLNFPSTDFVRSLTVNAAGHLFAATSSNSGTGAGSFGVYKWDGSAWSNVGAANGSINVIRANSAGDLYIAGDFTTLGSTTTGKVAKFTGSQWSGIGNVTQGTVYQLELSDSTLWISGTSLAGGSINYFENGLWTGLPSVLNGTTQTIMLDTKNNFVACGSSTLAGTTSISGIAKYTSGNWSPLATLGQANCQSVLLVP